MGKAYLQIPLSKRLEAFKRNNPRALGGGWHDPAYVVGGSKEQNKGAKWNWVPAGFSAQACRGGEPFKLSGSSTELTWCEDLAGYFRNVEECRTGWYVDSFHDETCHGFTCQLPARNGEAVFLFGVSDPWNKNTGMIALRRCEWANNKEDAARWADSMAETYAESCREDNARETAKMRIEEAKERIAEIRLELRATIADTRQSGQLRPKVCEAVRGALFELRAESRACFKRIAKLENNYWAAVEN